MTRRKTPAAARPSPRASPPRPRPRSAEPGRSARRPAETTPPPPQWYEPMLATLTDERFSHADWIYEPKFDGERCLAFRQAGRVRLMARSRTEITDKYPEIVEALDAQPPGDFVVDGEVVAIQGEISSFGLLQNRIGVHNPPAELRRRVPVHYYLFDLLFLRGRDLAPLALKQRKAMLAQALDFADPLRLTPQARGEGVAYYQQACRRGWEGVIAKHLLSTYEAGRSANWLKFKCVRRQEFVVGGYTEPKGSRIELGALLVGYYDDGELAYAGMVGTGFTTKTLRELAARLKPLEQPRSPFRKGEDLPPPSKGLHWVRPELVAEIGFAEWTAYDKLRQPRFMGLRFDRPARQVVRERPRR